MDHGEQNRVRGRPPPQPRRQVPRANEVQPRLGVSSLSEKWKRFATHGPLIPDDAEVDVAV